MTTSRHLDNRFPTWRFPRFIPRSAWLSPPPSSRLWLLLISPQPSIWRPTPARVLLPCQQTTWPKIQDWSSGARSTRVMMWVLRAKSLACCLSRRMSTHFPLTKFGVCWIGVRCWSGLDISGFWFNVAIACGRRYVRTSQLENDSLYTLSAIEM